jgi:hypothetical protein
LRQKKQDKRKAARGKAASSLGLFDRLPQRHFGGRLSSVDMQDYFDKVERYRERALPRRKQLTPQERLAARVEELRAAGRTKAVETAAAELGISRSVAYDMRRRVRKLD